MAGRKYGKNETTLTNVLKLVKALLALADDGKIAVPREKLKAAFKVEWVKEDELSVSGTVQQKRNNKTQTVEKGITKKDLWALVECFGEVLELSQPKDGERVDNAERKANAIQDIIDCLRDLEILVVDEKISVKNQGFWKFHLKLKQTAEKQQNLKLIKERWKIKIGSVTVETSHETMFVSKDKQLNWQEICRQNLAQQKQLTTNPFTNANGMTPQLDGVYVPLAIVERKPPKLPLRNQPEEKEEEKVIPIAEQRFFEDVLRQGKSQISQGRKIAIIDEPGSGKTTRLQKIADWILEQDLGLPIWISLADLTQPTITQYLAEIWLKQTGKSLTIDELTQQKEQIWLLLDGLDEMTSRVETRHVSALLGGWVQAARVVVTCRVNVWEADKNAFSGFDVFRNLEFNPEQVTGYIRRWFAAMRDAATGESLEAALAESENSRLKELIQNPLRLWMLCQIWQTGGGLPETQAGLYGQFVDWVYRWKADEEILDQREAIDKALARLALAAMEQKDEVSRLRLPESWVLKVLGSRPIFQAVMKLGWLNRVGRFPEAIFVFYHATFQEYFAALAVDNWDYFLPRNHVNFPVTGKEYRIFAPQWKQVILLWLGRGDVANVNKEKFINKLMNFDDGCHDFYYSGYHKGFYGYQAYFFAALGLKEFSQSCHSLSLLKEIFYLRFQTYGYPAFPGRGMSGLQVRQTDPMLWEKSDFIFKNTHTGKAVLVLVDFLNNLNNPSQERTTFAIEILGNIGYDNRDAIVCLSQLLEHYYFLHKHSNKDKYLKLLLCLAGNLKSINIQNQRVVKILEKLIQSEGFRERLQINARFGTDDLLFINTICKLALIEENNLLAIDILSNLLNSINNEYILGNVAYALQKTNPKNINAINTLNNLSNSHNDNIRKLAIVTLHEIDPSSYPLSSEVSEEPLDNQQIEKILEDKTPSELLDIFRCGGRDATMEVVIQVLHKIFSDSLCAVLTDLFKDSLGRNSNFNDYRRAYSIIWQCAENLPYPQFYQAWHGLTETQTSPLIQTLNLAQLPQLLQTQLTETNLHKTLQLLCIDTSKFIDPNNPAPDIYEQFLDQNCPERCNGEPETLSQLKSYWNRLRRHSHKPPILIFYEDPTSATARGLSPTFLEALTRFDGTICLIADTPHPLLQTFSPHDPDLLQTVVNWLKRLHL